MGYVHPCLKPQVFHSMQVQKRISKTVTTRKKKKLPGSMYENVFKQGVFEHHLTDGISAT